MLTGFDHIVLVVADVPRTIAFYRDLLGMEAREERPGKFSLYFGEAKISLQSADARPALAAGTLPGTANFCLVSDGPVADLKARLEDAGVEIIAGPGEKSGALGPIWSIYFRDPDGNLVEIAERM